MKESPEEIATLYVLDQLEPRERARAEARLVSDPAFAALVRDYESALAAGIRSLPPRPPSPLVLENLEDQLDRLETGKVEAFRLPPSPPAFREARMRDGHNRGQQADEGADVRPPRHRWVTLAQWGIAAVVTLSLATLAVQSLRRTDAQPVFVVVGLDANRNTFAELPTQDAAAKDPDSRFMQLASAAANLWRNPSARPAAARFDTGGNRGYALFDPGSQQGFIAVEQLPAIEPSQRYHLWMIDEPSGRIRDAGILPLAHVNRGLFSFALDPATASKSGRPNFFITIEEADAPSAANEKPRGKVVLGKDRI